MITGIIYKYTFPSNKHYIGQTIDEITRKQNFYNINTSYRGKKIDNARKKYGPENFTYEILYSKEYYNYDIAKQELNLLEIQYINKYNSFKLGYNSTLGGQSLFGYKHSKHTKSKMHTSHLGKTRSEESILKFKKTISKRKITKSKKFLDAVRKSILQYTKDKEFLRSFISISEASKITGINGSNIGECCYGRRKSAGGYIWKFNLKKSKVMAKELTRFEMAVIKRTAANTKSLRTKRDKLNAKIVACQVELDSINTMIEKFEQPIKEMTGGYTSEEVLNGIPELQAESVVLGEEETKEFEPVSTEIVETEENSNVEDDEFPFPMLDKE